jgi:hypothetical protein
MDWRDIGIRAAKTAVQAFIATVGVGLTGLMDVGTLQAAALAAASAAISVVMNALLAWAQS